MIFQKLLGIAPGSPPLESIYVGGYVQGFAGITTDVTIPLTSLTGGMASAPAAGDVVVVYFASGSAVNLNLVVAGFTSLADLYADDTYDTNLEVAYKVMGSPPDTTITLTGGTFVATDAGTVAIQVFRFDFNTLGITATNATGINSGQPNPPAVTPTITGSLVVSGGAAAHNAGTLTFTSSNLTDFITVGANDTYDSTIGMGYNQWTSGTFDPAQFGGGSTATSASWAASTLLLPGFSVNSGFISYTLRAFMNTAFSIPRPTGAEPGDLLVLVQACNDASDGKSYGAIPVGWSTLTSSSLVRVAVKIVGYSEPSSYSVTGDLTDFQTAAILCYRGFMQYKMGPVSSDTSPSLPTSDGFTVLAFATAYNTPQTTIDQSSYFSNNKIFESVDNNPPAFDDPCTVVFRKDNVAAGGTGDVVFTPSQAAQVASMLFSLKPWSRTFPSIVGTNDVTALAALPVPAHKPGDWLVVVTTNHGSTTIPTLLAGYTNLGTMTYNPAFTANDRGSRVQYIISDGTITSIAAPATGSAKVAVLRGISSVGQSVFGALAFGGTFPTITGLTTGVNSIILAGTWSTSLSGSTYSLVYNFGAIVYGTETSTISDITISNAGTAGGFVIEFLP